MNTQSKERREFYRIDDIAIVKLTKLTDSEYIKSGSEINNQSINSYTLGSSLAAVDQEYQTVFSKIKRNNPDIALFLESIHKKIDLISEYILSADAEIENLEPIKINLSGSGVAVPALAGISLNDKVEVKLVLLPHKTAIVAYGAVNRTKEHKNQEMICIDFEYIKESDQELIVKHTMNKQLEDARNKLHNHED